MNILCPTDFSVNAELANQFAVELSKLSNGKLYCFHSYDLPYSDRSMSTSLVDVMRKNAEENMSIFQKKLAGNDIDAHTEVLMGNPIRVTKQLIKRHSIDLVVMGTKGASGLEEFLIGSNAASVIQNVDIPVYVIPPKSQIKPVKRILLASDLDLKQKERPLLRLKAFAKLYNAHIDVVHVKKEGDNSSENEVFLEKMLGETPHSYIQIHDDNVENAILSECESRDADVVAAITKRYGFVEGLFHQSFTSRLAYHTTIPMLALHEPK
ncbi:MAG: universal stress protein [Owenweeksia sp.]